MPHLRRRGGSPITLFIPKDDRTYRTPPYTALLVDAGADADTTAFAICRCPSSITHIHIRTARTYTPLRILSPHRPSDDRVVAIRSPPPWHAASRDHLATVPPPLAVATLVPLCDYLVAAAVPSRPTPRHHSAVSAHPSPLRVTALVPHSLLRRLLCVPRAPTHGSASRRPAHPVPYSPTRCALLAHQSPAGFFDKKRLELEKKGIEGTVEIATGALNAAKGVMSDSAYLGDKAALDTAREILASTQQFGSKAISAAQATIDETDITTQVALNKAKQTLAAIAHGPEQGLFCKSDKRLSFRVQKTDNRALVLQAALKAAHETIANITQAVEYVVYQTALHSLAAAQQSTTWCLQVALEKIQEGEDAVLNS
ncbi:hypothetical protein B0H14DRAFT_3133476 [Mycena olivaceomarginata]|nr:hypothetical protein B0H14DRAFT_3133476 [Mycena olivaceomarginata]